MAYFKTIPGYSRYEISSDGSTVREIETGRILKSQDVGAYRGVYVVPDHSKGHMQYVHRLVCMAFHGETGPTDYHVIVAHIDDDKTNNHYRNLRWSTRRENWQDGVYRNRTWVPHSFAGKARFSEAQIRSIRNDPRRQKEIAKVYKTSQATISAIKRRVAYKHVA